MATLTSTQRSRLLQGIAATFKQQVQDVPERLLEPHLGDKFGGTQLQLSLTDNLKDIVHYEWLVRSDSVDIALVFEADSAAVNDAHMQYVLDNLGALVDSDEPLRAEPLGQKDVYRQLRYRLPLPALADSDDERVNDTVLDALTDEAVARMLALLRLTHEAVAHCLKSS